MTLTEASVRSSAVRPEECRADRRNAEPTGVVTDPGDDQPDGRYPVDRSADESR
jgi:hypothetical protein